MKLAAVQMVSAPDVARNLAAAARLVAEAAAAGARLVALPEYFCFMGHRDTDKLAHAEAPGRGPVQSFLAATAREHRVWLVGGTLPIQAPPAADGSPRVFNSCFVHGPDGRVAARYDKRHLFGFRQGDEAYDEARTIAPGGAPVAFEADGHRVGLSVCYDLRFPELYRALCTPPCALLCVPAAFTHTTGRAHWELLLRARAVENQCFVLAPAQGGRHENGRRTFGHSLIAGPWGEVLACREDEGEGVVLAGLDGSELARVRAALPALAHRRG
jgi:nitrilase